MRDFREYDYEKPEGVYRIIILGDSYMFGNGVELENSLVELLRNKFNNTEIINLGVPGYGIIQEYNYFMTEGIKYNQDLVVLHFSPIDWGTHIPETNLIEDKKGYVISRKEGKLRFVHLFLLRTFRSYSFFYTKNRNLLEKASNNNSQFQGEDSQWIMDYKGYSNILKDLKNNSNLMVFVGPHVSYLIEGIYTIETVKSLDKITNELDIPFMFVENEDPTIFLKIDSHWTIRGNQIVTDKLQEFINDR